MVYLERDEWGARPPKPGPGYLGKYQVVGIALHWPGHTSPIRGIGNVSAALRNWQRFHMDTNGWSDIAYQEAVDQDGNVYRLRGIGTQSGANGNTDLNERFGALLLVLAQGEQPTEAMLTAARGRIGVHRDLFPNSTRIVGHGEIRPDGTACPGPAIMAAIRAGKFLPGPAEPPPNRVERARHLLREVLEDLGAARRLLEDTPADREAAHKAAEAVHDARRQVRATLERMPKA